MYYTAVVDHHIGINTKPAEVGDVDRLGPFLGGERAGK